MPHEYVVLAANLLQVSVPLLTLVAYVPQWVRLFKTKSSEDISFSAWALWAVSTGIGMFYAIVQLMVNGQGWPLVISATSSFSFVVLTLAMVAYYKHRRKITGLASAGNPGAVLPQT